MLAPAQNTSEPVRRRGTIRRAARRLGIVLAVIAGLGVAMYTALASEFGLAMAVRILVARSEGRLEIVQPAGSLLSEVRVKRLVWRGPEATLSADEVALNWYPAALWSRGIVVRGLGAQRITFEAQGSDSATTLPASLALPTAVAIAEIAVAHFDWRIGTNSGTITGLRFSYTGGPIGHRVDNLTLVAARGALTGEISIDAQRPFAVAGKFALAGDATLKEARAEIAASGRLDAVAIEAAGRAGEARFTLRARLSPLAAVVLDNLSLDAQDLDLATWNAAIPATRLGVKAEARPIDGGLAGEFEAINAVPGPIDAQRWPVRSLRSHFSWRADAIALDQLSAELAGSGRVTGRANVPLDGDAGKWNLDVRDVDLKQIHSSLVATRLSGTLGANLDSARQQIEGSVSDRTMVGGIGLSFAATVADRKLVVERFRISAGDGELTGGGRIELTERQTFELAARARHVDPSRFGKFPAGALDGDLAATGTLQPAWRFDAKLALTEGSRLAGVPLSGSARASVAARIVRDAAIDVKIGSAQLTASGSAGGGDDRLTATFDAPRLAELVPFLPLRVPRPLTGSLRATADLRGDFDHGSIDVEAKAEALKIGPALALGTFDAHVSIAPAATAGTTQLPNERKLAIELGATALVVPPGTFPRARARVEGTLARHTASIAFAGADLDVDATLHGGARESRSAGGAESWTWAGSVDTFENRGPWPLRLAAPAALEFARDHVHIGAAHLDVADGTVELVALAWDDGRISTRGSFSGVPLATIAKLAGAPLPFASTLTLAGDWSLAAAPRLNGSVTLRRERGDVFFGAETTFDPGNRAFGVTAIDLSAEFRDDAVEATADFRSAQGVNADAQLSIGVAANAPPGHLAADAPLRLALTADLATLKVLQPWVGTAAVVDGTAHAEIVARGTMAHAPLSGTLRGDALRIEAPQYGVFFTDGRLDARLADGTVTLHELSFAGGAGRFTASGTLATTGEVRSDGMGAAAQMTWHAEKFRVFNRPDLHLVVDGSGNLAMKDRKVSLDGSLVAEEGHVEYAADSRARLGDDVVVKGWPARNGNATLASNLPLAIDLELDLGNALTFAGEGLDTGLRGKVRVMTGGEGGIRGRGSIQAVNGTYRAFGQRLTIERGRLIFDGPLDNPGLDIVALRKNLAVEAGVAVSGTVKVPIIQLTSIPPVPDNEKLSWLVLGQGLDRSSGADVAALQAASAALLGRGGKSPTTSVAESVGLDDISVQRGTGAARTSARGTSDASGQVVAFGKRISDKLSLVYEQGLTVATNALRLEYSLSRTLTLRAEAGAISGFGIYYRRTLD